MERPALQPLARGPVLAAVGVLVVVLSAVSTRYGLHRDELYFRMLDPAWGYVDQPPLAPLLVHGFTGVLGDTVWAIRIPATLSAAGSVVVVALVTRELGGGRGAQALCAWAYAFAALPLAFGHVFLTASLDLVVWPGVLLLIMRALLRDEPRWWLAAGLLVGLSTYNKLLIAILLAAIGAGLAIAGPRRPLRSPWVLGAAALALAVGAPNFVYQATHHWPQLSMGRALSKENGADVRLTMWPFLAVLLGPPLVPIWIAGLVGLVRRPAWRPVRGLAPAFAVLLLLVCAMGSQLYYPLGLLAVLFAAGCVPAAEWMARSRIRGRVVAAGVALNAAVSAVISLPLLPLSALGAGPVPAMNEAVGDQVGWPAYVGQIAAVYRRLPPADAAHAVIVTSNYGEAGAVARYGRGLPRVYSGHNQLYVVARPPASASVAVFVGGQLVSARTRFRSCTVAARLDDGVGVDNEEQGEPVAVCRGPIGGWPAVWPALEHRS
jgi:hypothetical protein